MGIIYCKDARSRRLTPTRPPEVRGRLSGSYHCSPFSYLFSRLLWAGMDFTKAGSFRTHCLSPVLAGVTHAQEKVILPRNRRRLLYGDLAGRTSLFRSTGQARSRNSQPALRPIHPVVRHDVEVLAGHSCRPFWRAPAP